MNLHQWSSLWRGYDLSLGYNRVIAGLVVVAAVVAAGWRFVTERALWPSLVYGVAAGAVVFFAHAIAKEIHPDRPSSAVAAAVLGLASLPFAGVAAAVALFWVVGSLRVLNRTTGLATKLTDSLLLLAVAAWLTWQVSALFGFLMGAVLLLDAFLPDGRRAQAILGALTVAAALLFTMLFRPLPAAADVQVWQIIVQLAIAIAFIPVILSYYRVSSVGDVTREPLRPLRVQTAQAAALAFGLILASWDGLEGTALLSGLWAALVAVLGYYYLRAGRQPVTLF